MNSLTKTEIDSLWEKGYRPYEIYTFNNTAVNYYGEHMPAGSVAGWEILHVFAKRETLESFPFFDAVICLSDMSVVTHVHHGGDGNPRIKITGNSAMSLKSMGFKA